MGDIILIKGYGGDLGNNPSVADIACSDMVGKTVTTRGTLHAVRSMGKVVFVILRKRDGLFQCVLTEESGLDTADLAMASALEVTGVLEANAKAPHGYEILLTAYRQLSHCDKAMPVTLSKKTMNVTLDKNLDLRPITLRNLSERAKFRIQMGICEGFRNYLTAQHFTEIHTPKISARSAEGGANIFKLDYFHRPAVLAQSPQFYKQMMVGVFERVFEVGPVFRAEKHNTKRHLNEYTSLDFEMGYIDSFYDIMKAETGVLSYIMENLKTKYAPELELLGITSLPCTDNIPSVRFDRAKELVSEKYQRPIRNPYDLEPEEEALIGRYFKEEYDADFVFITHYPSKKRPFYAMDDPTDDRFTLSFDCLFRGLEITTGGQRIHQKDELLKKIEKKGMTPEGMEHYLLAFECGMPPHGGLGIGLERLTMQLLGEDNVRETTLFPRDMTRLEP